MRMVNKHYYYYYCVKILLPPYPIESVDGLLQWFTLLELQLIGSYRETDSTWNDRTELAADGCQLAQLASLTSHQ